MEKKNKGLADNQDGDFILNESGTSINVENIEKPLTKNSEGKVEAQEDTEEISTTDDV